jgi:hypothetical protein
MIHGGNAGRTIQELYPLMQNQSIFPPSAWRLLRLVNGRKCERCHVQKVDFVRPHYGVFFCWDSCLQQEYTQTWNTQWVRYERNPIYEEILEHPRVTAILYGKKYYVWKKRYTTKSGEDAGPLVTYTDIERVAAKFPNNATIESIVEHAPPASCYQEFVDAYESCKEAAKTAAKLRHERKEAASKRQKAGKLDNVAKLLGRVQALLDAPWKDFSLQYDIVPYKTSRKFPPVNMKTKLCGSLLHDFLVAPSKAKTANIDNIATEINNQFRATERNFVGFPFLSDEDEFESKVKGLCQERFPDLKSIVFEVGTSFYELVGEQQFVEALECLFHEDFPSEFGVLLLPESAASPRVDRDLACTTFEYEFDQLDESLDLRQRLHQAYTGALHSFSDFKEAYNEYIESLVQKAEDSDRCNNGEKNLGLSWLVQVARSQTVKSIEQLALLQKKDFESLEKAHDYQVWLLYCR